MFYEVQPGYHIKLDAVTAYNIYLNSDSYYSRKLNVTVDGKTWEFVYETEDECHKAYQKLHFALMTNNNYSKMIMD